ncbi:hypothetical protein PVAND_011519 [Polypedilum vanderplanki]|uniref:Kinetochore protein SPC25 n=1 Tax=Polypedilum vanderplanki TaxID=319348 RepID=A0A9J6CIV0_POLVA|nr:hypothetical protein PVAND_011519 [Polypedilum vanderplanki]
MKFLENLNSINDEIAKKLAYIEELRIVKEKKKDEEHNKLQEIVNLKMMHFDIKTNQESIKERNKIVREKLNDIDNDLKQKADTMNIKQFFKKLGIRTYIQDFNIYENELKDNLIEVKIEFIKSRNNYISFVYDITTDDFDLLEIHPECEHYDTIRTFLRQTRDIQGLLSGYRASLKS